MNENVNFNRYPLSDGTIVSVRKLRAATEVTFISKDDSWKIKFYAMLSGRAYTVGEDRCGAECPEVIVWTVAADEIGFRGVLENHGISGTCLEEFCTTYQTGTGWGCWIGRRRARAKVELGFDRDCLPTI